MKKSRLAVFLFNEDQRARISIEVAAKQLSRCRAGDDRAAAIVGEVITIRASPLCIREKPRQGFDDFARSGDIDEADVDHSHSRHPIAATAIVIAWTATTSATQPGQPPKRQ